MSHTLDFPTAQPLVAQSTLRRWWPILIEVALLALAAPLLYFPGRIQAKAGALCACDATWLVPALGVALLLLLWPVRRWLTGRWAGHLPAAWALWFWFLVMLPVAIWMAPPPLRDEYSWPRAY